MKTCYMLLHKITAFAALCLILSCDKAVVETATNPADATQQVDPFTTVIPAGQYTFTDVEVCKDGTVYVIANGRLKKLSGNQLTDEPLPSSVYTDFEPKFLAISNDFTFFLSAGNGIKKIKNRKLSAFYPDLTAARQPEGAARIAVDSEGTLVKVAFSNGYSNSYSTISTTGQINEVAINYQKSRFGEGDPTVGFDTGSDSKIWISREEGFNAFFWYGGIESIVPKTFPTFPGKPFYNYESTGEYYGESFCRGCSPADEGPVKTVAFGLVRELAVSKNGKTMSFFPVIYYNDPEDDTPFESTELSRIRDGVLKRYEGTAFGRLSSLNDLKAKLALSYDGKTLYMINDGLYKIEDF